MAGARKTILFLSALDFKEKSIQVIRKTPEAFVASGWRVIHVVARDDSRYGNYSYERVIDPKGVEVCRFVMPMTRCYDSIKNKVLRTVFSKIRSYLSVFIIASIGFRLIKKNVVDVVYGYEVDGVLAANLLKAMGLIRGKVLVSRFQGTFFYSYLSSKRYLKALLNWDHFLALYLHADISIMTDDGTQGDKALMAIRSRNLENIRFWVNGVDQFEPDTNTFSTKWDIKETDTVMLTVCRLESWKRVERGIQVLSELVHRFGVKSIYYFIVGDGSQKQDLQKLASELRVSQQIVFVGAVPQNEVNFFLSRADFYISTYDYSNVGNPLLEAIRANKVIFTLNNGDTASWIQHFQNGFIYDIDSDFISDMATDIHKLLLEPEYISHIKNAIRNTEVKRLWTWQQRFEAEVNAITDLVVT
ncbi:glycosyltransferase family 4 protein [Geobacter hydrogenophilus]|uniref:Glycosyl transferase family 1 domain-containing protein n=1 Tax=Geobacter hydrogenophilus TaxID=40983 RepID=A0A9W6L9N6_9BACT|nr:glycosyltransferase family 4 protein [Geobacter hydrogenophilus]MBT0894922.1 glycosyltransferase family 4 protein [Geobacter hydrogenophilus]GLI36673.1 hypothetical protein GHYDROH2_01740 [Geobacter hydrogenophilus]